MKAEEILNKVANEHSYDDWAEAMYDTHSHTQIEFAVQAMKEFSSLQIKEAIEQIEKYRDSITKPTPSSNFFAEDLKPFGKGFNNGVDSALSILKSKIK
jgi:predicted metalloprotease with PDZ domain